MLNFLITLLGGLSLGGIYALIALGYTMVYGIAKMLNFAHGDIIMVGGYTIMVYFYAKGQPFVATIIAILICIACGLIIEFCAYRPLRGASPLAVLITAIGVSYLLQSIAQLIYGTSNKIVMLQTKSTILKGTIQLFNGQLVIKKTTILTLIAAAVIMICMQLFVSKTKIGKAMLAVSEDRSAATLMGVNSNSVISITFAIGSALAAVASFFYILSVQTVSVTMGSMPGIKAFTAAVIGGIGSIPGAMLGGILLGIIEAICNSIPALSKYTVAIEFSVLILILLVKPTGLLGKKKREKV